MLNKYENSGYIKYNIGDIVKERDWIYLDDKPMYGMIIDIDRGVYKNSDWIPHEEDRIHVYWFRYRYTESLPAIFVEIVSICETIIKRD